MPFRLVVHWNFEDTCNVIFRINDKHASCCLIVGLLFDPEDGGSVILRNYSPPLSDNMQSHATIMLFFVYQAEAFFRHRHSLVRRLVGPGADLAVEAGIWIRPSRPQQVSLPFSFINLHRGEQRILCSTSNWTLDMQVLTWHGARKHYLEFAG
jgi:hypothetical protein